MQYETASTTRQPRGEHRGTIKGLRAPLRDKDNTFTTIHELEGTTANLH